MAKELVASKKDIITLCRETLIKVLNTCKDKEKARQLEFELDQVYGARARAQGHRKDRAW